MSRMERYNNENKKTTSSGRRLSKNQELYQNFASNAIYTNITDVTNANAYEINNTTSDSSSYTTRESYQQMQKYQNIEPMTKEKKDLEDYNKIAKKENKVYDINSVLEEARKNRGEVDVLDDKRKLKNKELNILSGKNMKKLEKYREEKKRRLATPEEEEIRELMDTIASKTLAGELKKEETVDLLSDLMATNMLDKVDIDTEELIVEAEVEKEDKKAEVEPTEEVEKPEEKVEVKEIRKASLRSGATKGDVFDKRDNDFYTRSMDLSDKDFEFGEFADRKLPLVVKIIIILVVLALIIARSEEHTSELQSHA